MKFESTRSYLFGVIVLALLSLTVLIGMTPPAQPQSALPLPSTPAIANHGTSRSSGPSFIDLMGVATPTVSIRVTDGNASESGPSIGVFTVERIGDFSSALTVNYAVGGTAASGSDYITLSGTVHFDAGSPSETIILTPVDDALMEGDETVIVALAAGAGYQVGSPASAMIVIADNDIPTPTPTPTPTPAPEIRISDTRIGPPWLYLWKQAQGTSLSGTGGFTAQGDGILFEGANTSGERIVFFAMDGSGGRIHQGGNESGEILFTVNFLTGRIWAGPNTSGPLLYTLETVSPMPHLNVRVREGSSKGPIIYTISDDDVYAGPNVSSPFVYHGSEPFHGPIQFLLPLLADARIP